MLTELPSELEAGAARPTEEETEARAGLALGRPSVALPGGFQFQVMFSP